MQKIRKGDKVVILTGKDKGRSGEVLQVMPKEDRAVVRGIGRAGLSVLAGTPGVLAGAQRLRCRRSRARCGARGRMHGRGAELDRQ